MAREDFLNKYGEKYYLRDFDFFPEKLSERIERQKDISWAFMEEITSDKSSCKIFDNELDALLACMKVRETLGLTNSVFLKARTFDKLIETNNRKFSSVEIANVKAQLLDLFLK